MLGQEANEPIGYPDVSRFRIIDMFTACTTSDVMAAILQSFMSVGSKLRLVVATVAFGMGLDCPDARRIIHWGPPSDIEEYVQETGTAGRDGITAYATLFFSKQDLGHEHIKDEMKLYCRNTVECRRQCTLKEFDAYEGVKPTGCLCCDICSYNCFCSSCLL